MIMIISPEVVNVAPPTVTKGIEAISWSSMPRKSAVLSGCFAMTLTSSPATPPLVPKSDLRWTINR